MFLTEKGDKNADNSNRPPIIPFEEFAREDIYVPPKKEEKIPVQQKAVKPRTNTRSKAETNVQPVWLDPDPRPTGYDTPDDDNEEEMEEQRLMDGYVEQIPDNAVVRWFKDTYIGSPYDSRKKQQARYVIRNITIISFVIGFVFTAVWYAFPGKFISYRGDTDFTERYTQIYQDPSNLLENDFQLYRSYNQEFSGSSNESPQNKLERGGSEYFDNAEGMPQKQETRFSPESSAPVRAPGRSADL